FLSLCRAPPATRDTHDYCQNQADNEQNPRDVRGCSRNSAKAENSGNERYDQKSNRPTNHLLSPVSEWDAWLKVIAMHCRLINAKAVPKGKSRSGKRKSPARACGGAGKCSFFAGIFTSRCK